MARAGRKKIVIDWPTVEGLCKIHCTGEEIAAIINVSYDTLERAIKREKKSDFADYYKKHSSSGKASLRRRQFKSALDDGNVTMQIWLGKQYLGQTDKSDLNLKANVQLNFDEQDKGL